MAAGWRPRIRAVAGLHDVADRAARRAVGDGQEHDRGQDRRHQTDARPHCVDPYIRYRTTRASAPCSTAVVHRHPRRRFTYGAMVCRPPAEGRYPVGPHCPELLSRSAAVVARAWAAAERATGTRNGEQRDVVEPDRSHLWIDAGSPPCSPQIPTSRPASSTRPLSTAIFISAGDGVVQGLERVDRQDARPRRT